MNNPITLWMTCMVNQLVFGWVLPFAFFDQVVSCQFSEEKQADFFTWNFLLFLGYSSVIFLCRRRSS